MGSCDGGSVVRKACYLALGVTMAGNPVLNARLTSGGTDPAFTLRVYARSDQERERLKTLVGEGVVAREKTQTSHKTAISAIPRRGPRSP